MIQCLLDFGFLTFYNSLSINYLLQSVDIFIIFGFYYIIIIMSQLNLFQRFVEEELFRSKLTLNERLSAILDYCEYSTRGDFNESDKLKYKSKKSKKKEISQQFIKAFCSLSRQEKAQYYIRVVSYLRNFINNSTQPLKPSASGTLNDIGYSRSFNIKRWKQKKLRLDQENHIMFAERQDKIKTYEMKDYLLRISKNKQYYSFVLEAINNSPPEKSRTVHIGFSQKSTYQKWFKSIKYSIEYKEWEIYYFLYFGKAFVFDKSSKNDVKMLSKSFINPQNSFIMNDHSKQDLQFLSQSMVIQSKNDDFNNNKQLTNFQEVVKKKQENIYSSKENQANSKNQKNQHVIQLKKQIFEYENKKQQFSNNRKTIVDELIDGDIFQEPDVFEEKIEEQDEETKFNKKHLDLFHRLYPEYELDELQLFLNYSTIHEEEGLKIYQNSILQKRLKLVVTFSKEDNTVQKIISLLSKVQTFKTFNENVQQMQIKTNIPSQNSALIYLNLKPFNRLYRSRDFVFIRHLFKSGNTIYMIDKSIENTNYPPFMTIVRGTICIVYGVFERSDKIQLIADVELVNEGYLNQVQETNLTLKFLKGFNKLGSAKIQIDSYRMFDLDWDISKNEANKIENEIRARRKTINQINLQSKEEEKIEEPSSPAKPFGKKPPKIEVSVSSQKIYKKQPESSLISTPSQRNNSRSPSPAKQISSQSNSVSPQKIEIKRFNVKTMDQIGEISGEQELKQGKTYSTSLTVQRQFNNEGKMIIDSGYKKHHYPLQPIEKQNVIPRKLQATDGHPIWKNEWIHDDKEGGIIFIHKKKIEDQKGVLKFILSKMAKNLVSGQSVLSISLPVDIFCAESNLQRFIFSMCYGPALFENLEKESALNRLIKTVIFGITNSVLYLSMQKPFNPILGETFQCWINGCPAYAEQISHHPPVGALMLKGRGYEITAQIQSKVSLGVNTGTGTNEGIYRVKFNDNIQVCFITPGGEVSGLSHGDRKFNLVGKSYYWITNSNIMLEIIFDPFKKSFFSVGKAQQPSDYFEGTIWEVRPQFMTKFLNGKRKQPEQKDRIRDYGKVSGIWNKYLFNFQKDFPFILEFQPNPIPSDANWREDIEFRRRNQVTKAQSQKERLEVLQRKDKKNREKYYKKK